MADFIDFVSKEAGNREAMKKSLFPEFWEDVYPSKIDCTSLKLNC
jgi:hypothetical protein